MEHRRSDESLSMSKAGYASERLVQMLQVEILESYSEFVSVVEVPNSLADRTARRRYQTVLKFSAQNGTSFGSSVFINAAHHPRELSSVQMVLYTMLRFLYEYEVEEYLRRHGHAEQNFLSHQLLRNHALYVVPVVNMDGFS